MVLICLGVIYYLVVGIIVLHFLDRAPDWPSEPDEGIERIGAIMLWPLLLAAYIWKRKH